MSTETEFADTLSPAPAEALAGLLGVGMPDLGAGEPLPFGWHWIYLLDRPRQDELGRDGHPAAGLLPADLIAGKRRMWAGGQIDRVGQLRIGETTRRRSAVVEVEHKSGRSGPLVVAHIEHRVFQRDELVLQERQDLVYREPADSAGASAQEAGTVVEPDPAQGEWELGIDPTLLFRFSALTYNAHRIHYDREYATGVEGYPGLVTHGPLQAIVMAEAARARYGPDTGRRMAYRLVAPLFDAQGLIAGAAPGPDGIALAARDRSGRRTAVGVISG